MQKEILINVEPQEKRVALVNEGRVDEFYIERPQDKTIVGNIYKGKIEAVIPSINGAFVDIGLPKKGFLYLSEIEDSFESVMRDAEPENRGQARRDGKKDPSREVKKGQEVMVQVVKESFGTKGPRLSCQIGIAGRYLVLMPQDNRTGVSKRIEDEAERKRLKQILLELKLPKDLGFIVRTAASGREKKELFRDARFLMKLWSRLDRIAKRKQAPSLIYEEYDLILRVIRDSFSEEISKVVVDSKAEFYRIKRFMRVFLGDFARRLEFYKADDLFEAKNIEKQISKIFETRVYLKSKGYLIIEPTEGLVVIDVNSGGFREKITQEEAAFKINCEAAIEAAHQVILRDLGGIIVIDFIDMERESHRREVLNVLKRALSPDKAKYDVLGISKFGLVEMTRERIHNTVQTISYQTCPYCSGKGKVKSAVTMAIFALKEIKRSLKGRPVPQMEITLNPLVYDEIVKEKSGTLFIERKFKTKINLIPNPTLHIEEIKIV
ncbi:MAG: Rne/Rng family ribonuclease, partial [Candidatus Omnitrophica bacterium]|nr:Rne/Rng family ribonuclease [Candidatus Omnitrophota bacterium]